MNEREKKELLEYERRKRRRQMRRRQQKRRRQRRRILFAMLGSIMALLAVWMLFLDPLKDSLTIEAGSEIPQASAFLKNESGKAVFVTDVSLLSAHTGENEITIKVRGREHKTILKVVDTTAPAAEAEEITIDRGVVPEAKELVKNVSDATDVVCTFKEEPELSQAGEVSVTVVLTDEGGNKTEIASKITVIVDEEPPLIWEVKPLVGIIGEPISYKTGIRVTDDCDKDVKLEVDTSRVNAEKAGTYPITYSATDRAGNTTTVEGSITICAKAAEQGESDEYTAQMYELADEVLAEITTEDMDAKQKAKKIYKWCRGNIGYVNTSDKSSWIKGAYQGFTERSGDCFVYFSVAKALLTRAGIPNLDVVKSDTSHSRHYWSLADCGTGWYHFDTTPRQEGGVFFMLTDEQLMEYSKAHHNSHIFDRSLYPATPTEEFTME